MKILSPERMAKYDGYSIETWGIPSAVLMENAGRNTYRLVRERYVPDKRCVVVFCGKGNNGGDGFVIARYAAADGHDTRVFLLGKALDLKGDAGLNMRLYTSAGGEMIEYGDEEPQRMADLIRGADLIVDAIFGTGLSKPVEGKEKEAIEAINGSAKPVIAVDIPSGIDGNTGLPLGSAIHATHTFTFAYPKLGHILYPGAYHSGRLTVIDISVPAFIEDILGFDGQVVDGPMLRAILKRRLPWSHKGSFGHVAVIAGSKGKTGAAHMASLAALKIGAGLVTLLVPESLNHIMEEKLTEVMTYPVPDGGTGVFTLAAYDSIMEFIRDKDVVVMGPGLSLAPETMELTRRLYAAADRPLVLDADGINAFQGHKEALKNAKRGAIITPHPGELARIMGVTPKEITEDRIGSGRKFVAETGVHLVLKGARTLIFGPDGRMFINPTGNAALAKGGSGDILTGFIGGLLSQGYSPVEASLFGTYVHGYLADTWVQRTTDMDLLACDLLSGLGEALKDIRDGTDRVYIEESL
jgi:ADP-dependent NAD(P)H-hydrate dehydratase / NAD(P)H-hydrate epimerase